jgi:phage head maturation protease
VFRLIKAGYIKAGSVGFAPLKFSFAEDSDRAFGIDFHEQELLEFSIVPIPANAHALVQLQAKGLLNYRAAERSEPALSVMQYAGTGRDRRYQLAQALRKGI